MFTGERVSYLLFFFFKLSINFTFAAFYHLALYYARSWCSLLDAPWVSRGPFMCANITFIILLKRRSVITWIYFHKAASLTDSMDDKSTQLCCYFSLNLPTSISISKYMSTHLGEAVHFLSLIYICWWFLANRRVVKMFLLPSDEAFLLMRRSYFFFGTTPVAVLHENSTRFCFCGRYTFSPQLPIDPLFLKLHACSNI